MRLRTLVVVGGALALTLATPANAAVYLVTVSGTAAGIDFTGVFGGGAFSGINGAYTAVYRVDTDRGAYVPLSGHHAYQGGGTSSGTTSPVSATFTYNGVTVAFAGAHAGYVEIFNNAPVGSETFDGLRYQAQDFQNDATGRINNSVFDQIGSYVNQIVFSTAVPTSLDYTLQPGDTAQGFLRREVYSQNNALLEGASANLYAQRITVALEQAGVPEPATWALLIAGFGAVGGAMRRRGGAGLRLA